jgi:histidine triad (HIT) family protein
MIQRRVDPVEPDCVFCSRLATGQYDVSNGYCVSFEPLNPVTPGHRLVVPFRHVADALEDPWWSAQTMMFASRLADRHRQPGEDVNIITSAGPAATQTVMHLHLHIVPRRAGDGLMLPWTARG